MTVVALVGRPNVGKSTLFNRLTGTRDALVANRPGLTRDRRYGRMELAERSVALVDTGGLLGDEGAMSAAVNVQARAAIEEADLVLLMVDARDGLTAIDEEIVSDLRKRGVSMLLAANKIDGVAPEAAIGDFSRLGLGAPLTISATQGRGMTALRGALAEGLPDDDAPAPAASAAPGPRVAVVGRPNVGKSTLVNRLIGDERQVVFDAPGTTRDAIDLPFERDGRPYVLIDTAGVRRRGRVSDFVEKFSVVKALDALDRADVAFVLVDAREGIVEQDLHLVSYAADAGTGLVLVVNKWDGLSAAERADVRKGLDRRMVFAPWAPIVFVSALHGSGVGGLVRIVDEVYAAGRLETSPSELTDILERAVADHAPPSVGGRPIKLRYAHRAGSHPPTIVLHGNRTAALPASYVRYLENVYREALGLVGMPVRIALRTGENPYAGKRNELTRRQRLHRKRVIRRGRGR